MLKIISVALSHNGKKGGQCKIWVQQVMKDALGATLPTNTSLVTHLWNSDPSGRVLNLGAKISSAAPGDAVQMIARSRKGDPLPHTAIVGSNDGKRIRWLESNYKGDEMVTSSRTQTYEEFVASLPTGLYTVYRVR